MRRLMLLRHAKSARPAGVSDLDRPLSARGRRAAPLIGAHMAAEGLVPDVALVSPARRARETWGLVRERLGPVPEREDARLYDATAERLLAVAQEIDPGIATLLMVGHNPGFEELANWLVGSGDRDARERLAEGYPTAALAIVDLDGEDWRRVAVRSGRLDRFVTPRLLDSEAD